MTLQQAAIGGVAMPEAALSALRGFEGPVLLDLDETLYLRNSTEDFIDSARPALLVLLLLRVLDVVRPWRWTGGVETRDVWRVGLVRTLFPWVMANWRRRVGDLAARHANASLIAAAAGLDARPIVVTVGFRPIVEPLIAALGLPYARIVATRMWGFDDRRRGKLALAIEALGSSVVQRSLVVTDSVSDRPLLDACAMPLRTVWPYAHYRPALAHVYLPGRYLAYVKRPNGPYFAQVVLKDEFVIWILASITLSAHPLVHLVGLSLLLISFWAVYEQGYVDNDHVANRYEADGRLSAEFWTADVATPRFTPWVWAAVCGAAATVFLRWPTLPSAADFAVWAAVLAGTALWFRMYNRVDKPTRVWVFWGLPLARSAGFAALVPIVPAAPIAIGAHVLARWVEYYAYRREKRWPDIPTYLVRLLQFVVLSAVTIVAGATSALQPWPVATVFLAFFAFKARRDLSAAIASARRLDAPRGHEKVAAVPGDESDARPMAKLLLVETRAESTGPGGRSGSGWN